MSTIEPREFTHDMVHRQAIPRQNSGTEWNIFSPSSLPDKKENISLFALLLMTKNSTEICRLQYLSFKNNA